MSRVVLSVLIIGAMLAPATATASGAPVRCMEDEPCWTWPTMGNLQRGVYTHGRAARVVVSPCQYRILRTHGRIDHARTPRLRGDTFALRNGCRPTLYAL